MICEFCGTDWHNAETKYCPKCRRKPMKTAREYQEAIGAWAEHNFTYIDKVGFGIIEELGEYCHAILKSRQGIRRHALKGSTEMKKVKTSPEGMRAQAAADARKKQEKLDEELSDCIADGMIFTLHWAQANETFISFEEARAYCEANAEMVEFECISLLLQCMSLLIRLQTREFVYTAPELIPYRQCGQRIFNGFAMLAKSRGWRWENLLASTWEEVSKRDWIKYPTNGKDK